MLPPYIDPQSGSAVRQSLSHLKRYGGTVLNASACPRLAWPGLRNLSTHGTATSQFPVRHFYIFTFNRLPLPVPEVINCADNHIGKPLPSSTESCSSWTDPPLVSDRSNFEAGLVQDSKGAGPEEAQPQPWKSPALPLHTSCFCTVSIIAPGLHFLLTSFCRRGHLNFSTTFDIPRGRTSG